MRQTLRSFRMPSVPRSYCVHFAQTTPYPHENTHEIQKYISSCHHRNPWMSIITLHLQYKSWNFSARATILINMTYTGPQLSLHVSITVAPENVEKFLAALRPAYEGVIAEPENIFFEVYQEQGKPGVFRFVENWNATAQWFQEVRTSVWMKLNTGYWQWFRCNWRRNIMFRTWPSRSPCGSSREHSSFSSASREIRGLALAKRCWSRWVDIGRLT